MAYEILSVKLQELEKEFARLHSRIELSQVADRGELQETIQNLQKECQENRLILHKKLKYSRAKKVQKIFEAYEKIEGIISPFSPKWGDDMSQEDAILMAEYSLDFAMQAANHALLSSLQAMKKQYDTDV